MSRSGYSDSCEGWQLIRWRGAVAAAIKGVRGQTLLRDMLAALDAMPVKELIAENLETPEGGVCALSALGRTRGIPMTDLDPHDRHQIGAAFDIAPALAAEIAYENDDESFWDESDADRWQRVRGWVASQIKTEAP